MRDSVKNKIYFDNFIVEDSERIRNFEDKLKKNQIAENRIQRIHEKLCQLKLGVFIAKYSRGDDLSVLHNEFYKLFEEWKKSFNQNNYNVNLKMVSLSVLFNLEENLADLRSRLLQIDDWLISFMLDGSNDKNLVYPEHYEILKTNLENKKFDFLKDYVNTIWFDEKLDCFEMHKSDENLYYGYWNFESAAIIKKFKIADSELKTSRFYPYDLVHYFDN